MIEVKINLVPFGMREGERQIGYIKLCNDGTGNTEFGNYRYEISDDSGVVISGSLRGFKRERNIFHLLKEVLDKSIL